MISRVAENCFWLERYMERAESTARLLMVTRSFLLDADLPDLEQWHPLIVVTGEKERFRKHFPEGGTNEPEVVQEYLTWDERCPAGIFNSIRYARENARTIREVISLEMWESINALWHWMKGRAGRRLYEQDRDAFFRRIKDSTALFQGICQSTMLHEEPFDFMRLGTLLERASQTARRLDVKYHLLGPTTENDPETPLESAQWVALLQSCSAEHSYFRRHHSNLSGPQVAAFLLLEEPFPRSVFHCLTRARSSLVRIEAATGRPDLESSSKLEVLVRSLASKTAHDILSSGLHAELTAIIDATTEVCTLVHSDYFDPMISTATAGGKRQEQTQ